MFLSLKIPDLNRIGIYQVPEPDQSLITLSKKVEFNLTGQVTAGEVMHLVAMEWNLHEDAFKIASDTHVLLASCNCRFGEDEERRVDFSHAQNMAKDVCSGTIGD